MTIDPNLALGILVGVIGVVVWVLDRMKKTDERVTRQEARIERHESICAERQSAIWKELRRNTLMTAHLVAPQVVAKIDAQIAAEEREAGGK